MPPRHGLLLTNLGTPDDPQTPAVRRYLAEFLWDRHVLDINPVGRWLLLHGIILRTRPSKSAHAYQKVWTDRGSPLMFHSQDLTAAVQAALGPEWKVSLGMRYGNPSLEAGLAELSGVESITVLPLYPQYASASTYSTLERLDELLAKHSPRPTLKVVRDFYADPGFIDAQAAVAKDALAAFKPDRILYSFHGIPERHLTNIHPDVCKFATCCDAVTAKNALCYRAQAFATARALATSLNDPHPPLVAFQSRLGKIPWIRPYTDEVLTTLPKQGIKRLAILCPSFTADCLETLEEIGLRAKEDFIAAGGEDLIAIPCVNSHPRWVEAVVDLARTAGPPPSQRLVSACATS